MRSQPQHRQHEARQHRQRAQPQAASAARPCRRSGRASWVCAPAPGGKAQPRLRAPLGHSSSATTAQQQDASCAAATRSFITSQAL
jgi:hypothetical protein